MEENWYLTTEEKEAAPATVEDGIGAMNRVFDGKSEFFVFEPEPDSEKSFIQASLWSEGLILGTTYIVEVRGPKDDGFVQLRLKTKNKQDIIDAFNGYVEGDLPSGRGWVDVTDEFEDF